jgi:hypothetical protein
MANNDNSPSVDLVRKSMKGKYDGRRNNGATKARRRLNSNLGRKPRWLKNLDRNDAAKVLEQFDAIASPEQIYKAAWEKGKFELCADLYKQFQDRWLGKPFLALVKDICKHYTLEEYGIKEIFAKASPGCFKAFLMKFLIHGPRNASRGCVRAGMAFPGDVLNAA